MLTALVLALASFTPSFPPCIENRPDPEVSVRRVLLNRAEDMLAFLPGSFVSGAMSASSTVCTGLRLRILGRHDSGYRLMGPERLRRIL
jgi:hypothetical protein